MIKFLKIIFTWWNGQTIGTFLNTLFFGKLVGIDDSQNKYYVDNNDRRWVIFNSEVEATKIPPEWHAWIHHLIKELYGFWCFYPAFVFPFIFACKFGKSGNSHLYLRPLKPNCTH